MRNQLKEIITPFGKPSRKTETIVIGVWIAIFLSVWVFGDYTFLPSPKEIMDALQVLISKEALLANLIISIKLSVKAIFFAVIISTIISYLSMLTITKYLARLVSLGRFLTLVGLSFFFNLMTDGGDGLKLSILVFSITVFFTTSFISEVNDIKEEKYNHARTLGLNRWETFYHLVILGKIPQLIEITIQTFAISWSMLTLVEGLVRSGGGVGIMLLNSNRTFSLDKVFAINILVVLIGLLIGKIFLDWVKGLVAPYTKLHQIKK